MSIHPNWFSFKSDADKKDCINSIAKRIVGEIVADYAMATVSSHMTANCDDSVNSGDDATLLPQ